MARNNSNTVGFHVGDECEFRTTTHERGLDEFHVVTLGDYPVSGEIFFQDLDKMDEFATAIKRHVAKQRRRQQRQQAVA